MDGLWLKKQTSNMATKVNQSFILPLLPRTLSAFNTYTEEKNGTMGGIIKCTSHKFKYSLQGKKKQ